MRLQTSKSTSRLPGLVAAFVLLSATLASVGAAAGPRFRPAPVHAVEDEWLVAVREHVGQSRLRANSSQPPLGEVAETLATAFGGEIIQVWGFTNHGFAVRMSRESALRLSRHPFVDFVEQNARLETGLSATIRCTGLGNPTPVPDPPPSSSILSPQAIDCPDLDPRSGHDCVDNWGLARGSSVDVPIFSSATPPTYEYAFDGSGVHVYVIDIGIDAGHAEFQDSSFPFSTRIGAGYNTVFPPADPNALSSPPADLEDCFSNGHGTHVSAIVGGLRYGVAKGVTLHPIKYADRCDPCPGGICGSTKGHVVTAINKSVAINLSLASGSGPPRAVVNFSSNFPIEVDPSEHGQLVMGIENLVSVHDIPFVQSAGNQFDYLRAGLIRDACSMTFTNDAIIVGASDLADLGGGLTDVRWVVEGPANSGPGTLPDAEYSATFCQDDPSPSAPTNNNCGSNTGPCIDVWAPGAHIVSARRGTEDDDCHLAGTSMAAAQVSGLLALLLEEYPSASPAELESAVRDYAVAGQIWASSTSFAHYSIKSSDNLLFHTKPPEVSDAWVDFAHTNVIELGTESLPFDSLAEGLAETDAGHVLHVVAGSASGAVTIDQHVTVVAEGGPVTLGL